jgi:hypothetical protein
MKTKDASLDSLIKCLRQDLHSADIAAEAMPLNLAWWPDRLQTVVGLMAEDGIIEGPEAIVAEFNREVRTIQNYLDKIERGPDKRRPQDYSNEELVNSTLYQFDQRQRALRIWEQIAFPIRRSGDVVFRIRVGTSMIEAMPTDEFIRGACIQTTRNHQEMARLIHHLRFWRIVAALGIAVLFISIARHWF